MARLVPNIAARGITIPPSASAMPLAFITALAFFFSILSSNAHAEISAFSGLAGRASVVGIEIRHHLRRHRRIHEIEKAKPQGPQKGDPDTAKSQNSKQPPMPSPEVSEPEKPKEASKPPEPLGPPPPPQTWAASEVEAGRKDCDRRLSGLHIIYERIDPIREGACGLDVKVPVGGDDKLTTEKPEKPMSAASTEDKTARVHRHHHRRARS